MLIDVGETRRWINIVTDVGPYSSQHDATLASSPPHRHSMESMMSLYMSPKPRKKIVVFSANILENVEIAGSRIAVRDLLASTLQKNHIAVKLKKVLLPLRENPNVDRSVCLDTHPFK